MELFINSGNDYVDGSSSTDSEIDTTIVYALVKREAKQIAENIHRIHIAQPDQVSTNYPDVRLSKNAISLFYKYLSQKRKNIITDIRIYGSDTRDE